MTKILTASRNQTANKLNGCNEFIAILENIYEVLLAIITAASSCSLARRFPVREIQSPAAAELMNFMQKDLIHAFE